MFCIEYDILDGEKNRLSSLKEIEEFESDFNTIAGQIHLKFNNEEIGFVDGEIPYDGEFVLTWLQRLNTVIKELQSNTFVTMSIPDSANIWLEFKKIDEMLLVTQIRAKAERYVQESITNIPQKREECCWTEHILIKEFYEKILMTTYRFIKEIVSINELLLAAREVIELVNLFQKTKESVHCGVEL